MIAVVIKQFATGGETLRPGTVVDSSAWRNEAGLLRTRILRPASASEVAGFLAEAPSEPRQTAGAKTPRTKAEPRQTAGASA